MLAVETLRRQGIQIDALCLTSAFFGAESARQSAKLLGINLLELDISKTHLALVKSPPHGYGQGANPCLDCHKLMVRIAGLFIKPELRSEKWEVENELRVTSNEDKPLKPVYDFVATGEVLGQRPFSQTKSSLRFVEKQSGIAGYLLRPLSAQLLETTIPEQRGLVDRSELFGISGRGRETQKRLAKDWGIINYPQPAGGCVLTQKEYGQKLKKFLSIWPDCCSEDVYLLRIGRHFFFPQDNPLYFIVLGRNKEENYQLSTLALSTDMLIKPEKGPGPLALIHPMKSVLANSESLSKARELILTYSKKVVES